MKNEDSTTQMYLKLWAWSTGKISVKIFWCGWYLSENMYIFSYLPSVQVSSLREAGQVVMDMKKALLAIFLLIQFTINLPSSLDLLVEGVGMSIACRDAGRVQIWQTDCKKAPVKVICLVFIFHIPVATLKYFLCHQDGIAKICWFENFFFLYQRTRYFSLWWLFLTLNNWQAGGLGIIEFVWQKLETRLLFSCQILPGSFTQYQNICLLSWIKKRKKIKRSQDRGIN